MELLSLYDNETMMEIFTLNFLVALGNTHLLHKEIDKVYSENKLEFYEAANESNILKSKLIYTYPTAETERIIKLAGIYHWSVLHKDMDLIERFIKIGFREVWDYTQRNTKILLFDFLPSIYKTHKEIEKHTEQERLGKYSVLFFLCLAWNTPCELGPLEEYVRTSFDRAYFADIGHNRQILERITTKYRQNIKELFLAYRLINRKFKKKTLYSLFTDIYIYEKNIQGMSTATSSTNDVMRFKGITKYTEIFLNLFILFDIDAYALEQCELTYEELNQIFATYFLSKDEIALPEYDRDIYLVAALYIKAIVKEYQDTRNVYLANAREENHLDTLKMKKAIDEKELLLQDEQSRYITEIEQLKAEVEQLQTKVCCYEQEATLMKRELETGKLNAKELFVLRGLLFIEAQDPGKDANEPDEVQKYLNLLNDKACAVIGGHKSWVDKIKENLPTFTYVHEDSLHKDLRYLGNKEFVLINTDFISHALYEKVMAQMTNNKTKFDIVRGTSFPGAILKMGRALELQGAQ
ncbi:hypothetical protein SBF1_110015 [Candidatus Desulfosporosinus infrequens]|uniref:DUF2325 domain-containing protein n=1 Tax=Candidatus Desulfosporosinus infrequens TaxID=2043169 RepID=A0A2U3JX17_9FIRM|nr:hypothetical protein SBF1_110015 [Candidatus Desulfosporosinus infrequens]